MLKGIQSVLVFVDAEPVIIEFSGDIHRCRNSIFFSGGYPGMKDIILPNRTGPYHRGTRPRKGFPTYRERINGFAHPDAPQVEEEYVAKRSRVYPLRQFYLVLVTNLLILYCIYLLVFR